MKRKRDTLKASMQKMIEKVTETEKKEKEPETGLHVKVLTELYYKAKAKASSERKNLSDIVRACLEQYVADE